MGSSGLRPSVGWAGVSAVADVDSAWGVAPIRAPLSRGFGYELDDRVCSRPARDDGECGQQCSHQQLGRAAEPPARPLAVRMAATACVVEPVTGPVTGPVPCDVVEECVPGQVDHPLAAVVAVAGGPVGVGVGIVGCGAAGTGAVGIGAVGIGAVGPPAVAGSAALAADKLVVCDRLSVSGDTQRLRFAGRSSGGAVRA